MKFIPRASEIIGRTVVLNPRSQIIIGDMTKQTKFIYVDAVGELAGFAGFKQGQLIVPKAISNISLDGGTWRPFVEEKQVAFFVTEVAPDDLLVQTDDGKRYVPFESPEAARPLGVNPEAR